MVDLLVRSYVLVGAMLTSKRLGLLLGYITMGTICYSVMVKNNCSRCVFFLLDPC